MDSAKCGCSLAMSSAAKLGLVIIAAMMFGLLVFAINGVWPWTKLQTLSSPDGQHTAELSRADGIDRNYTVRIDRRRVYTSPDFAPRKDLPFRETLVWDATGKILMLEVARHRIFGYDVAADRQLSDEELLATQAAPDPPLSEYYFESEWPGIGRARQGEANEVVK